MNTIETKRLIIRKWTKEDAKDFYAYASYQDVGPMAGWSPHKNIKESLEIIDYFLSCPHEYAIELKENSKVIGSIGLFDFEEHNNKDINALELGYVLSKDYWGQGLMPEAVNRMLEFAFEDVGCDELWCGHYDFNDQSKRVVEKSGFIFEYKRKQILDRLDHREVELYLYKITKEQFLNEK